MRVALVYRNFNLGGSLERDVVLLARALAAQGVEVHCYCNPETRTADAPGVTFYDVKPLARSRSRLGYPLECGTFALAATRALRRDRGGYDIIDVSGIAAWEHDVVTVHGVIKAEQRRWPRQAGRAYRAARARAFLAPVLRPQGALARTIERLQFRPGRFRRVIAVTELVREDLVAVHRVPPALIDVIPPSVDVKSFARRDGGGVRRALGLGPDDPILLFVGHDFKRKGLSDAIAALAELTPAAHLVVVGNGEVQPFLREAERLGVARRVHFVGPTEEPEDFYADADLLVLPTRQEPWGLTLIEAMAAGLPVITTEVAGAAGVVRASGAGLVLADGSAPKVREAASSLLRDPARRREMAERGRAAAGRFSGEAHARATLQTYEKVLAEGSPPQRFR